MHQVVGNIRRIYDHFVGQGSAVLFANSAIVLLGVILRFAVGITLARALGVTEYGTYAGILALVEVFRSLALLGLQVPVTRYAALYKIDSNWSAIRGLTGRSTQFVLLSSLTLSAGFIALTPYVPAVREAQVSFVVLSLAAFLIPLGNLGTLRTALLAGLDRVALSRLPEMTIRPVVLIAGIGLYVVSIERSPTAETAVQLQVLASVIGLFVGYWWLQRIFSTVARARAPTFATKEWVRAAIPFIFLGILQPILVQVDVLSLTFLTSAVEVGIFRVASILASGLTLPAAIVIPILFPKFVRFASASNTNALQDLSRRAIQGALLLALPGALLLIILAEPVLSVLFGQAYAIGAPVLSVLTITQVLMIPLLFPSQLLAASGHTAEIVKAMSFGLALSVCLNLVLIPLLGAFGAALATLLAQTSLNGYLAFICYKILAVNCLSLLSRGRSKTRAP